MSRLWDTPESWARGEADEALREMPDIAPGALADSFERNAANYDGEPEMAAIIIAELRHRAAAGIRFWAAPQSLSSDLSSAATEAHDAQAEIADLIDDEIPW